MLRDKRSLEAGFSLVETVAAMGILALAAIPLLQISTDATRNAAGLEARVLARTVGENLLAHAMAEPDLIDAGIATGQQVQMGRTFVWTQTSSAAQVGDLQNFEIQVRSEGDEQVIARLIALKYIPAALSEQVTPAAVQPEDDDK